MSDESKDTRAKQFAHVITSLSDEFNAWWWSEERDPKAFNYVGKDTAFKVWCAAKTWGRK